MSAVEGNAYAYVRNVVEYAERLLRLPMDELGPEARTQVAREALLAIILLREVRETIGRADILERSEQVIARLAERGDDPEEVAR